jgi:hypothetical protein
MANAGNIFNLQHTISLSDDGVTSASISGGNVEDWLVSTVCST